MHQKKNEKWPTITYSTIERMTNQSQQKRAIKILLGQFVTIRSIFFARKTLKKPISKQSIQAGGPVKVCFDFEEKNKQ